MSLASAITLPTRDGCIDVYVKTVMCVRGISNRRTVCVWPQITQSSSEVLVPKKISAPTAIAMIAASVPMIQGFLRMALPINYEHRDTETRRKREPEETKISQITQIKNE